MTLFLDASAVVAMLAEEPDALDLADRLENHDVLLWSAMVRWEAAAALSRIRSYDPLQACRDLDAFAQEYQIQLVQIGAPESDAAIDAYARYGKGRDPAGLNLADCFAYACAKTHGARLLYKGDDFARTDLR